MLQLRFNNHDSAHRPSCFKKGCECRNNLPQDHQVVAQICFDQSNNIEWLFVDGTKKKVNPFKYMPTRSIGDQFMNINNDIASVVLACNTNVTSGDKIRFFYVTMYQSKRNQQEESASYYNICLALSKRIKYQDQLQAQQNLQQPIEEDASDYCEGLKRMLSSLYAHSSGNVLSATMAHLLLYQIERFTYSHDFSTIRTKDLIDWCDGKTEELFFRLRKVKNDDGNYDHVCDYFINNNIYIKI